ncbi:MAG: tripartite tricarboxylate transporter substrate binding protein [Deltaproteobacteria bacterium]
MKRKIIFGIVIFLSLMLFESSASPANFPEKPIKIIVNFPAGAGIDLEARGILPYVQKHLGVSASIENVPGADGKIGITRAWKAKPDGYTLILHSSTLSSILESIHDVEFRTLEFSHIYCISQSNQVLVVNSEKWKTFDEFVKAARERSLIAAVSGRGTAAHLSGLILVSELGIGVNWVPFAGSGEALTALAGGHVDFAVTVTTSALSLVKAGKVRPLVVFANKQDIVFPDVPRAKDLNYEFTMIPLLRGVDGPPKMEPAITKVIEGAFEKAVKEPDYVTWAHRRMLDVVSLNQDEYLKAVQREAKEIEKYKGYFTDKK